MTRLLLLPLLLLGFAASAQTTPAPPDARPRLGLNRPASSTGFTAGLNTTPAALCIVDGYLVDNARLSDLNPDQIASVSVVKGTEAVALYGERGRGGVIMITTKPLKAGR